METAPTQEPARPSALEELSADPSSRGRFLKALGTTGAVGLFGAVLAACGGSKEPEKTPGGSNPNTGAGTGTDKYGEGDVGIVRYALTIEYLEDDFYEAANGSGELKGRAADLARTFGQHEKEHIAALEKVLRELGSEPPQRAEAQFPLEGPGKIIEFASGLESLGVAGLLAQASRIQDKALLAAALSIHSVEARHVAALASLLGEDPTPQGPYAQPIQAGDVLSQLHRLTTGNAA
jgi:rubrerythrin